jgi:phosphonatase-like hydrolase
MSANRASLQPLLVVTDLMGTTLRDDGAVLPAYRAAFAECAIPFTEDELATKRGAHKLSLFTEFASRRYPPDDAARRAAAALEVFESQLRHFLASGGGTPIAGAEDAIARLRQAGIRVALTSGFDRGLIADIVAHCGWGELFDAIAYSDEVPAGRPAPYLIFQAMQKTRVEPVARVVATGDTAGHRRVERRARCRDARPHAAHASAAEHRRSAGPARDRLSRKHHHRRHSGTARRAGSGIIFQRLVFMDSGFAAVRRPGMTARFSAVLPTRRRGLATQSTEVSTLSLRRHRRRNGRRRGLCRRRGVPRAMPRPA